MEYDRPEELFKFFRAVFRKPVVGSWLRSAG
jgi:hypothetical protein